MPLITSTTNLKSLGYGSDRKGGGSSGQPYIQTSIPGEGSNPINVIGDLLKTDSLLAAPVKAAIDTERLSKMLFDLKSPNGLLFSIKQNLLSRISVKTEATEGIGYGGGNINQGIYLPTSTIAQAAVGFSGTHLNLLGIDPTTPMSGVLSSGLSSLFGENANAGLNRYEDIVKKKNESLNSTENRLVDLLNTKQNVYSKGDLRNYPGGPNSILGIGNTTINFADQRTGINNKKNNNAKGIKNYEKNYPGMWQIPTGSFSFTQSDDLTSDSKSYKLKGSYNVYEKGISGSLNTDSIFESDLKTKYNVYTYTQQNISSSVINTNIQEDFRKKIFNDNKNSKVLSLSPSYISQSIGTRVYLGDPGKSNQSDGSKNVYNYSIKATDLDALDKITAMPMYSSSGPKTDFAINDLVKFRMAVLDNDKTNREAVYLHFRAFIDSFSDSYSSEWNSINYAGRGDTLYNYAGNFARKINMSFTVVAQSKAELIPMYKKLNYLASSLAPQYNSAGFMRGNLVRLTLGGYLYEQYGFISSLTYDIPSDSTWEIGINTDKGSDDSVKELPHMIKVTGLTFTPIHNFLVRKVIDFNSANEQYIALSNGSSNNHADLYRSYNA